MPYDRFLVAPLNSGLQTDLRPWQIMDDAFAKLKNAYNFRGRVRKRFGSITMGNNGQFSSRLRTSLASGGAGVGITDVTGAAAGNVRTILADATLPLSVGMMFSVGTASYTVVSSTPGVQPMLATQGSGTFNITTGDYVIAGAPALTTVFFYPALPVMGLTQYESGAINNHPSYAFDPRYAYVFTQPTGWARSGAAIWHGNNTNYFWASNWQGGATLSTSLPVMFVTNFQVTNLNGISNANDDPIWSFDGTTWTARSGANAFYFLPNGGAVQTGAYVVTSRMVIPFKDRLVLLNTVENNNVGGVGVSVNTNYQNRARFSFNGSPFARNAWYEPNQSDVSGGVVNNNNIAAGAGWIDATTEEAIVSAEFIKDRLIVYFERSTWELAYTGNEEQPFVWQKLNTELGSQSTFSTVPFDTAVLTVGNTGVHACNGSNVKRIDTKIPDQIFSYFKTKDNAAIRTAGIRDYVTEMVYWAYCESNESSIQTFPNQVLAYNYQNGSWAIYDDTITCFGYFEQGSDMTWASSTPLTWDTAGGTTWVSSFQNANQRQILYGTPEGFVLIIDENVDRNALSMQITNLVTNVSGFVTLTIIDHNFLPGEFIFISNITGDATLATYFGTGLIFPVYSVAANTVVINTQFGLVSGTYTGGATAARVSRIEIQTKQFNPYDKLDRNVSIAKVNFAVQKTHNQTGNGEITVDYFLSASGLSMNDEAQNVGALIGTGILETTAYPANIYPFEQVQQRLWHPVYLQGFGECIQLYLYWSDDQMINPNISFQDFELEAFILYATRMSDRLQ